ncbi:NUCL1 [Symbiodinium necroappetens]|uniref:NUCL1 protein n=1 Tax=Symbiodinium necroappetens TaxID=1628268 RepID=A0A813A7X2_9DINO|nr:NUCL1 [Symbiodinium necroappetens]
MEIPLFDDGPADASITWGQTAETITMSVTLPPSSRPRVSFKPRRLVIATTLAAADSEAAAAEEEMLLDCELSGEDCQEVFQVCRAQVPPNSGVASDRPAVSSSGGKSGEMPSSLLCGGRQQCPVGSKDLQERLHGQICRDVQMGLSDSGHVFPLQETPWSKMLGSGQARSWVLVVVGVLILLRLRLILLAAALPLVAYWLEVSSPKAEEEAAEEDAELDESDEQLEQEDENKEDAAEIYDHDFWAEKVQSDSRDLGFSWEGRDELDDLLDRDLDSHRKGSHEVKEHKEMLDFDFGLGGDAKDRDKGFGDFGLGFEKDFGLDREPDFDFGPSLGNGHKGKGKDRDGKDSHKGKSKEPREADPKQVFVANIGEAHEDDLRSFFEDAGEVERLKVLRNPDGGSKGIGFVTFRTEEQAQKALSFHNRPFEGGHIVVRLAHGGKGKGDREKGEKGDKGEGREGRGDFRGDRENRDRPKGKGRGGGKGKVPMADVEDLIEQALAGQEGPLKVSDFDFTAKKFVAELHNRDRADGGSRFQEAMDMILKYTSSKDRSSVRKWPAYVFTLLQKFDPALGEEMRERDQERRQKGSGFRRPRPAHEEEDG